MTTKHRLNLVLPLEYWKAILEMAESTHRSGTGEIIYAVERHLRFHGYLPASPAPAAPPQLKRGRAAGQTKEIPNG
jgi:hypothetical protein